SNAAPSSKMTCRLLGVLPMGPVGPKGPTGPKGQRREKAPSGPHGAAGVSGFQVAEQNFNAVSVPNSQRRRRLGPVQTVLCPDEKQAIGGGANLGTDEAQAPAQRQVSISISGPKHDGSGWSAQLFNPSTAEDLTIDLRIFAICANIG